MHKITKEEIEDVRNWLPSQETANKLFSLYPVLTCPNCNEPCESIWVDSLGNDLCDNCWRSEDIEDINE